MKPSVGRIVHVLVDPAVCNGSDVCPAVVTRVWTGSYDLWTVNVRLFLDNKVGVAEEWRTSVKLHATRNGAEEYVRKHSVSAGSDIPDAAVVAAGMTSGTHAFWPPREEG